MADQGRAGNSQVQSGNARYSQVQSGTARYSQMVYWDDYKDDVYGVASNEQRLYHAGSDYPL